MNAGDPLFGQSLRQPPQNQAAEQSVLGALLANNRAYDRVQEFLRPEHFADPVNARIYEALARRIDAGQLADIVTLRQEMEASGEIAELGGAAYLARLLSATVGIINAGEYGQVIKDAWLRRELIALGEDAVNAGFGGDAEGGAAALIEATEARLYALGEAAGDAGGAADLIGADAAAEVAMGDFWRVLESETGLVGVTTGYHDLDRMTGGLQPGQLWVIGARPSMGKTAFGAGMAARCAAAGHRVLFVTAEMLAPEISKRVQAAVAGLPLQVMTRGRIIDPDSNNMRKPDADEIHRLMEAKRLVSGLQPRLEWLQRAGPTVPMIRSVARRLKRRGGLSLVLLDYLGLMRASANAQRQNRVAEVTEITGGLKGLAVELEVPVVALSQLSRETEKRDDPTPRMSDLRDSGSIEQDADVIGFLHREHYYLSRHAPVQREKEKADDFVARQEAWVERVDATKGWADLILAKQRQGPTGRVRMRFSDRQAWFFDEHRQDGGHAVPGI